MAKYLKIDSFTAKNYLALTHFLQIVKDIEAYNAKVIKVFTAQSFMHSHICCKKENSN